MIYPWQKQIWDHLVMQTVAQRLPHALLLTGMTGVGKSHLAQQFIRALLCEQKQGQHFNSCPEKKLCHACRLLEGGVHPNVLWIKPEKAGQAIKVEQIRAINEFNAHSALLGKYKIIVIAPAQQMNANAANALLKTLEEPTAGTILLLLAESKKRLAATILSRCQQLNVLPPSADIAIAWLSSEYKNQIKNTDLTLLLKLARGAPLLAAEFLQKKKWQKRQLVLNIFVDIAEDKIDPLAAAVLLEDCDILETIDFMLDWQQDMLSLMLCNDTDRIINADYQEKLQQMTSKLQMQKSLDLMKILPKIRKECCIGFNLNKQLTFENILIYYQGCFKSCS